MYEQCRTNIYHIMVDYATETIKSWQKVQYSSAQQSYVPTYICTIV